MKLARLKSLQERHNNIEQQIQRECGRPFRDDFLIQHLKKQKLMLRDEIARFMPLASA
jgi:hypothetical protein